MTGDRGRARALYLALLTRKANDDEAIVGLARVDAWDGCWDLAERGYRDVLSRHPGDAEARAGLVDLLLWQRRWDAAAVEIDDGLARTPSSAELLARRARLAHWQGDEAGALRDASAAERLAPLDPTLRAQRDELFLGEARLGIRTQFLPRDYDDVYTLDAEGMQRYRHLRFTLGHRVVARTGAFGGTTPVDGRRAAGAYYHFRNGGWAGLELAHAAPAVALPRFAGTLSALSPLGKRLSVFLSAAVWEYAADKTVFLGAPSIGVTVTDTLELGARYWVSSVVANVPGQASVSGTSHSAGIRAVFRPETALVVGGEYTYGVQLDQNPTFSQLLELRSHVFTVFARKMFTREIGVAPVVAVERRQNQASGAVLVVPMVETSLLVRW